MRWTLTLRFLVFGMWLLELSSRAQGLVWLPSCHPRWTKKWGCRSRMGLGVEQVVQSQAGDGIKEE